MSERVRDLGGGVREYEHVAEAKQPKRRTLPEVDRHVRELEDQLTKLQAAHAELRDRLLGDDDQW